MKKLLAIILAVLMMLAVTACSDTSDKEKNMQDAADAASDVLQDVLDGNYDADKVESTMSTLNSAVQDADATLDMTVAEYVEMLKESDEFKQLMETSEQQFIDLSIEARDNKLVYIYRYTVEVDPEAVMQAVGQENSAMDASVQVLYTVLPKLEKVITEFYNSDGTYICAVEY